MMVAGIKKKKLAQVQKFVQEMSTIMSRHDEDGVGYAAINAKGQLHGEKWLNKKDAFKIHAQPKADKVAGFMKALFDTAAKFKTEPVLQQVYESFGDLSQKDETVAMIVHARKKTIGDITVKNVHPFVAMDEEDVPQTALIHNGSIQNHEKLTKKYSTCDSEVILHEYIKNMMWYNPWAIEKMTDTLIGQYATGVLSSSSFDDGEVIPYLDVFKSNKELHAAYIPELEVVIFSTWHATLEETAKNLNMTVQHIMEIENGNLMRFNAITGERIQDVIPFQLSKEREFGNTMNTTNTSGTGSNHHRPTLPYGPRTMLGPAAGASSRSEAEHLSETGETSEDIKAAFEAAHAGIFTLPYHDVQHKPLTENEQKLITELESNTKSTDFKALHLVKMALGI